MSNILETPLAGIFLVANTAIIITPPMLPQSWTMLRDIMNSLQGESYVSRSTALRWVSLQRFELRFHY